MLIAESSRPTSAAQRPNSRMAARVIYSCFTFALSSSLTWFLVARKKKKKPHGKHSNSASVDAPTNDSPWFRVAAFTSGFVHSFIHSFSLSFYPSFSPFFPCFLPCFHFFYQFVFVISPVHSFAHATRGAPPTFRPPRRRHIVILRGLSCKINTA